MSRRRHEHADDHYGAPKPPDLGVAGLALFAAPPSEPSPVATPPVGVIPETAAVRAQRKREKVEAIHAAGNRRWIEAGKPLALLVARRDGRVTAETFRVAAEGLRAERRRRVLPPSYGEDRTLSYLSQMFGELVREGKLAKLRRADGSVVKVQSLAHRNEQTIYVLAGGPTTGRAA